MNRCHFHRDSTNSLAFIERSQSRTMSRGSDSSFLWNIWSGKTTVRNVDDSSTNRRSITDRNSAMHRWMNGRKTSFKEWISYQIMCSSEVHFTPFTMDVSFLYIIRFPGQSISVHMTTANISGVMKLPNDSFASVQANLNDQPIIDHVFLSCSFVL